MATMKKFINSLLLISSFLSLLLHCHAKCSYDAIYNFGDSISDTGNLIRDNLVGEFSPFAHNPYGESIFDKIPTGRCSNGLLMIDFIAGELNLPFLNPYLVKNASFDHGANFAVAGATAIDTVTLLEKFILSPLTSSSLHVQLNWFKYHLNSICHNETECRGRLENALFMAGEVGGNDIMYALVEGKTIQQVKTLLVPLIVNSITDAVKSLIDLGATQLVVPGNFAIGCLPVYLTIFKTNNLASYDHNNCLRNLNKLAMYQNQYLQKALTSLRLQYPKVVILYADYYNAHLWLLRQSSVLGFDTNSTLKACCGSGGDYNFNLLRLCGIMGAPSCSNPDQYISWDGIHMTEKAYQFMTEWLLKHLSLFNCTF
ncbi:hypothetical protein AQUCO_00700313v1 [Aquilegia coerulea]|uniref:Uncharacterized protein n=1 Tax=Aquilegia coerulea TaxID=218851 RepID=A0A2G5EJJ7_AQUCA|nr:hypothetical protein AQUCO_00700313v1 [Aquilegia coerulea]